MFRTLYKHFKFQVSFLQQEVTHVVFLVELSALNNSSHAYFLLCLCWSAKKFFVVDRSEQNKTRIVCWCQSSKTLSPNTSWAYNAEPSKSTHIIRQIGCLSTTDMASMSLAYLRGQRSPTGQTHGPSKSPVLMGSAAVSVQLLRQLLLGVSASWWAVTFRAVWVSLEKDFINSVGKSSPCRE